MLLYHANVMETIEHADEFKIDATVTGVQFADIVREVNEDVHGSSDSIQRGLSSSDRHELYEAEGQFVDDRTLELSGGDHDGERIRADTVLVAAGTRPAIPPIDGIETVDSLTSTEALQLETPPEHLVIVGGGYIAAELAQFFGTFGSDVSIVNRRPNLLPDADEEVATAFTERYADRFDVYTGYEATDVSGGGRFDHRRGTPLHVRRWRRCELGGAGLSHRRRTARRGRSGSEHRYAERRSRRYRNRRGWVRRDRRVPADDHRPRLGARRHRRRVPAEKHNANHEARAVARNLFGDELEPVDYSAMPFAVFASPEVAGVGLTEQELRVSDQEYAKRTYRYEETARGSAMKAEGFVKPIIDLEGEILGCHIIGPEASNLIQEVVVAMTAGSGTIQDIRGRYTFTPRSPRSFSARSPAIHSGWWARTRPRLRSRPRSRS